jgi:tetratricopeptide (TPR) repeat protein
LIKNFRLFALFCFVAGWLHFQSQFAEGAGSSSSLPRGLDAFLTELHCSTPLRKSFLKNLEAGELSSVVAADGAVYSLVISPVPFDSDPDVAQELESSETELALFHARGNLALSLAKDNVNRELYRYGDSLGQALLSYYTRRELKGIQTAAEVVSVGKEISPKRKKGPGRYAIALAWLSSRAAKAFESDVPPQGVLNEDYCRFLYLRRARVLFEAGKYDEALPIFKHIHDLRWADIGAYLDAAECFLKVGEKGEGLRLLQELFSSLKDEMNTEELSRTGRLFRAAGDRSAALRVFKTARERFEKMGK